MDDQDSDLPTRWQRVPRWVHRVIDGDTMLAATGGEHRTLGGLATVVWAVLEEPADIGELHDRITEWWPESNTETATLEDALAQLATHEVIEPAEAAAPLHD